MGRVLVAALVALIISILAGPVFIDFLRRHALGQQIREEGPEHHSAKQGTPTMGGVLIVVAATIAFLTTGARTLPSLAIFGTMLACGAIGFTDDLIATAIIAELRGFPFAVCILAICTKNVTTQVNVSASLLI